MDHYILWHTLGLIGADYDSTPQIEHFPDERYEKQYSDALKAADDHDLGPLQEFYRERIEEALESVGISGPVE
ncbi:MAG: hypothetical protein U5L04_09590 [Trueperaceae bacterium]|nr:hypothetical protein [Trueperaceae bacterium]